MICDAHVHFFSPGFFDRLGAQMGLPLEGRAATVVAKTGWQDPESNDALADRWVAELDRHGVSRAALIASVPGDERSVATAASRHPARFVGFFMLDPPDDDARRAGTTSARRRSSRHLPVSRDAALLAHRRPRRAASSRSRRNTARGRRSSCTAACCRWASARSSDSRARSTCASAIRSICTRSRAAIRRAVHHSALRRRFLSRGADARRPLSERASRHVELERLDAVHARADVVAGLPHGPRRRRSRPACSSAPTRRSSRAAGTRTSSIVSSRRSTRPGSTRSHAPKIMGGNFERLFPQYEAQPRRHEGTKTLSIVPASRTG